MTELEQFLADYEAKEEANDMKFSTYFIPSYYQPDEDNNAN